MKCKCGTEMIEDEMFASGGAIMITGNLNNLKRETRLICKQCKSVEYVVIKNNKEV